MRAQTLLAAASLSLVAVPAAAQDFLGRLAQSTAESAARSLADRALAAATSPRPAAPSAPAPAPAPAVPTQTRPQAQPPAAAASEAPAASSGSLLVLRNRMPVVSSDGVRVAEVIHADLQPEGYRADQSFFTTDTTYMLRRLYPREVTVRGDTVHLRMTAAQYRARSQNPGE